MARLTPDRPFGVSMNELTMQGKMKPVPPKRQPVPFGGQIAPLPANRPDPALAPGARKIELED